MTDEERELRHTELKKMRDFLLSDESAPLYQYRTENNYFPVIGEGTHGASIVFVGEAPGQTEAKTGRPFCGAAGKFLDVMLESIGLDRTSVYITNLVKDRPPENRDPTPEEIAYYSPLLIKQLELIKPSCVVTLGRYSMAFLMQYYGLGESLESISKIHGKVFTPSKGEMSIVTLYHPAVALYNGGMRANLLEDFKVLQQFMHKKESAPLHEDKLATNGIQSNTDEQGEIDMAKELGIEDPPKPDQMTLL